MKWPTLSPQKKLYAVTGLLLVVIVVLAIDHVALRRETTRLKRAIAIATATSRDRPDVSGDVERDVRSLEFRVASIESEVGILQPKVRRAGDLEARVESLEYVASRLKERIDDVPGTPSSTISSLEGEIQSLNRRIDQHGKHIREIMGKVGMWLPADLLGR